VVRTAAGRAPADPFPSQVDHREITPKRDNLLDNGGIEHNQCGGEEVAVPLQKSIWMRDVAEKLRWVAEFTDPDAAKFLREMADDYQAISEHMGQNGLAAAPAEP